jgi:heat shock protein HslJ
MPNRNAILAWSLATTILAQGCGGRVLSGPSAVTGGVWKLQSLETPAGGLVGISQPDRYTVEFKDAGALAVKADCNTCGGSYTISGEALQVGPLACTRAFCGPTSSDAAFLDVLSNARSIGVRGIELSIDSAKGTLRLAR